MRYKVTIVDAVFNTGSVISEKEFDTFDKAQDFITFIEGGLDTQEDKEAFLANVKVEEISDADA